MKSFRTLTYAVVVTLTLSLMPSPASAQSARGSFTLSHEVHWQNAVVPAGTYRFSLEPSGPSELLVLRSFSGTQQGFIILVNDARPSQPSDLNRLLLVSRGGKSFVHTLELSKFETTLHFTVPSESTEKELALASDTPVPTHLR